MDTLDKVVRKFVEVGIKANPIDFPDKNAANDIGISADTIKEAMVDELKKKIVDEVLLEKKKEINTYTKKQLEEERKKSAIIEIKELLWDALFVALFAGLLVNEISTLITFFKSLGGQSNQTIITVILIVVLSVIVLSIYFVKFTKDVINRFVKKDKGKKA